MRFFLFTSSSIDGVRVVSEERKARGRRRRRRVSTRVEVERSASSEGVSPEKKKRKASRAPNARLARLFSLSPLSIMSCSARRLCPSRDKIDEPGSGEGEERAKQVGWMKKKTSPPPLAPLFILSFFSSMLYCTPASSPHPFRASATRCSRRARGQENVRACSRQNERERPQRERDPIAVKGVTVRKKQPLFLLLPGPPSGAPSRSSARRTRRPSPSCSGEL